VTLAFLAPLAWMVWIKVGGTGSQGTMDLRLPLKWFYSAAAVGATVAAVLALARLGLLPFGREAHADAVDEVTVEGIHGS